MLDHFGIRCRNPEVMLPFYEACLGCLGIDVMQRQPQLKAVIFKRASSPTFMWIGQGEDEWKAQASNIRVHLGFRADTREAVDAFYETGLQLGGRDNGPPGYRRPTCYSAFVIDPEGNNIEAIWQTERPFLGQ
jgi:catechol 2,3-dioxygenase-like lactoylglutathione lyase family enzyme